MRRWRPLTVIVLVLCSAQLAWAGPTISKNAPAPEGSRTVTVGLDAYSGVGQIFHDLFTEVTITGFVEWKKLSASLRVPLRFRLKDYGPASPKGTIRPEDWDEISDYLRVIPYIAWGTPNDAIFARLGEITDYTLGHGTLISGYFNSLDIDHYQAGLVGHFFFKYGGAEVMLDNVVDPSIFGVRAHVRPLSFFFNNALKQFSIGVSFVADFRAPLRIREGSDGRPDVSKTNTLQADLRTVSLWGFDLDWPILLGRVTLTPYADVNFLEGLGTGVHTGLTVSAPINRHFTIAARAEYRYQSARYMAEYVNPLYEIERFALNGSTKQELLRSGSKGGRHGALLSLTMKATKWVRFSTALDFAQGPQGTNLLMRLDLPGWDRAQLSALWVKRSIGKASDLDEREHGARRRAQGQDLGPALQLRQLRPPLARRARGRGQGHLQELPRLPVRRRRLLPLVAQRTSTRPLIPLRWLRGHSPDG